MENVICPFAICGTKCNRTERNYEFPKSRLIISYFDKLSFKCLPIAISRVVFGSGDWRARAHFSHSMPPTFCLCVTLIFRGYATLIDGYWQTHVRNSINVVATICVVIIWVVVHSFLSFRYRFGCVNLMKLCACVCHWMRRTAGWDVLFFNTAIMGINCI